MTYSSKYFRHLNKQDEARKPLYLNNCMFDNQIFSNFMDTAPNNNIIGFRWIRLPLSFSLRQSLKIELIRDGFLNIHTKIYKIGVDYFLI